MNLLRPDLALIQEWIRPGSRVLDLGCGDGSLLAALQEQRQVSGYGLEIDPENVATCVRSGVNVIQADIDAGLQQFQSGSFDYVLMTQALQALHHPERSLDEMLRIGRTAIVTFPNFGHWRARWSLLRGRMPMSAILPQQWYETENIHLCTVRDFEELCAHNGWQILRRSAVDHDHQDSAMMRLAPNFFAQIALYMLRAPESRS